MISERALEQTLRKLERLCKMLHSRIFTPVDTLAVSLYETTTPLDAVPDLSLFSPLPASMRWGGEGMYGWFRGSYTVPGALAGQDLYLFPKTKSYEGTLWVNGQITSNYASKEAVGSFGNHYAKRFARDVKAGAAYDIAIECYAHHDMPGTQPLLDETQQDYTYPIGPMEVCTRNDLYLAYWANLSTLLSLVEALPQWDFRRADVIYTLHTVHEGLFYDPDFAPEGGFDKTLSDTMPLLEEALSKTNGDSAPFVGLIGHSHMDTAWLWPLRETVKKCARTYAGQLQLLEDYPEYKFVQSSAYHLEMIRIHHPELFGRIAEAIAEGRWEPNGGVWVECDCNLTGGEYMVRQFLWGQRYTMEHFGYRSDAFWLPDTFGYSYAIPQIMKKSGVSYFLTTKMAWNDTTAFPQTTFLWQGMDGTRVLSHLNRTHVGPTPKMLRDITYGEGKNGDPIREKTVSNMRLFSYGKGDGGGGPEFEMVEMAKRLGNLEGAPRSAHMTVSDFMHRLESTVREPTVYAGELYLELHRGTLTNQHQIKRNNRLAEIALHDLEFALVASAVKKGEAASGAQVAPLMNDLLVNQFHDILPGTCIHSVHALSLAQTGAVIDAAKEKTAALLTGEEAGSASVTLYNSLSFPRRDTVYLPARDGHHIGGYEQQPYTTIDGEAMVAVAGVEIPALGSVTLEWVPGPLSPAGKETPFRLEGNEIATPFACLTLDEGGAISSYIDLATGRQLRHPEGHGLNTFLMGEDVSTSWDNWDVDADFMAKLQPVGTLLSLKTVALGPVELRLRSHWRISEKSEIIQDMVLSAATPGVTFETVMEWHEGHRFMKTAFDTTLIADGARHEVQFGHIRRGNHRSTDGEKAKFEVCNHKYTDLSELDYGVSLLNDCKYGITVEEGSMWLSLHKGGMQPDRQGDMGRHYCRYAFLPHQGGFSAETVIQPAYRFNYAPVAAEGMAKFAALLSVSHPNVIIESVKPCEDADKAYILRLYEAAGSHCTAGVAFNHPVASLITTNLLEEREAELPTAQAAELTFTPFEIKTLRVGY